MKKLLFTTALLTGAIAFSTFSHAGEIADRVEKTKTLLVGTEGTYAPFTFHSKDGKLTGFDVEIIEKVAEKLGLKVEFKETAWDGMYAGLNAKRFDVIANQTNPSPERLKKYDYSAPYNYSAGVIVTKENNDSIKTFSDLKGKKSAQSATSNWSKDARDNGAIIVTMDSLAQNLEAVKQERVDSTVNDKLAVLDYFKKQPNAGLKIAVESDKKIPTGFVFLKGEEALIAKVNKALEELRQDGILKQLSIKWFGDDITQ
ncbi:amino acid ABC transporter substrate-binding protein [Haemophilus aegyptius]|nr:amino acid ABC transporter substrate-binding protein [Haemophilus aegyptius]OBX79444.1 amino acid ABC transporter substrate-binding protein [Haemophilus aegyptius]STO62519.1 extracellular solute-binding protein [Haemophilus aegyptius]